MFSTPTPELSILRASVKLGRHTTSYRIETSVSLAIDRQTYEPCPLKDRTRFLTAAEYRQATRDYLLTIVYASDDVRTRLVLTENPTVDLTHGEISRILDRRGRLRATDPMTSSFPLKGRDIVRIEAGDVVVTWWWDGTPVKDPTLAGPFADGAGGTIVPVYVGRYS